jgi:hypothetical protein
MFIAHKISQQANDQATPELEPSNDWAVHWI